MLQPGEVIDGKYRIVRQIGEGGMGAVYEGENTRISRRVAIKTLHAGLASNEDVVARFEREAQAAGRIGNDHILEILDLGVLEDGDRYMVMEFLQGEPLSERIQKHGRLTPQQVAPLMVETLEGLGAAHEAGIVHRDLKPDNIFILDKKAGNTDYVKIIDFGISKFQPLNDSGMKMTRTGAVMGTPYYMSPEQAKGKGGLDRRSDLYSIGVIIYEAVSGRVPFQGDTFNDLMFQIVLEEPPPLESLVPDLDPAFVSIVKKAMARHPDDRFQNAEEFASAIEAWVSSGTGVAVTASASLSGSEPGLKRTSVMPPGDSGVSTNTGPTVAVGHQTASTWSQSQPGSVTAAPAKSKVGLVVGLAAAAVLLVGGSIGGYFILSGSSAEAASTEQPETEEPAAQPEQPAEPEVKPAAEPAEAKPALVQLESDEPNEPDEEEAKKDAAGAKKPAPVAVRPRPAPRPAPKPVAAPTPAPKPAPKPQPASAEDVFGY